MHPFRNILQLSAGDFVAKTLNFLAVIYLARMLGVAGYGVLEFALSILSYFLLLADGGLEIWATRAAAQGGDMRALVGRVVPLRFAFATVAFAVLLALLPVLPAFPGLRPILILFGLTFFAQAANLKWLFMGREHMRGVAGGLVLSQSVFALGVFGFLHDPTQIVWVPVLRLAADLAMAGYFLRLFAKAHGGLRVPFTVRGAGGALRPALTIGASHGLGLASYNFDAVLLGFLLGPMAVGWYGAAYKPVTMLLAMPLTYFQGLFPVLSRTYVEGAEPFRDIVTRSLRLAAIVAVPIGVGGAFLAEPVIRLLFGPAYASSVPVLQVLSWSAVLIVLRGTYRQALNASGRQRLDLRAAGAATALNVALNVVLIPRYGMLGAACATLSSEVLWLATSSYYVRREVTPVRLWPWLVQPVAAAAGMGIALALTHSLFWGLQAAIGLLVYLGGLFLLGGTEVRSWLPLHKVHALALRR